MRLAEKLADRVVFLHQAKVIFFGTVAEMKVSTEPIVQEFLKLDELDVDQFRCGPASGGAEAHP